MIEYGVWRTISAARICSGILPNGPTDAHCNARSAGTMAAGRVPTSTAAAVTPAAVENFFNIYIAAFVEVPRGCCVTIAVENSSTQAISVSNSNLIVERES